MNITSRILALNIALLLTMGCTQQSSDVASLKLITNKLVDKNLQQVKAYAKYVPDREDDFAWENDLVAFRMYGPSSISTPKKAASGIDCWLKRVDYSIIDKWYYNFKNKVSYHTDWGEGHDPYRVDTSRGVGGTALWINGVAYPASTYKSWRIIDDNPQKVIFELDYVWQTEIGEVSETKRISLAIGSRLFEATSSFLVDGSPAKNLKIAIGITTHNDNGIISHDKSSGWMAVWDNIEGYFLGTGVVISPEKIDKITHVSSKEKNQSHIWLITHTDEYGKLNYAAGYGWEKAKQITTEQQWQQYLSEYIIKS